MNNKFPEVLIIENKVIKDNRGYFFESCQFDDFPNFVQENVSLSGQHVLRGLHLQTGYEAQDKLIQVLSGRIWDVVVDARKDSKTYGQWAGMELNGDKQIFIPKGFLHGFYAFQKSIVLYKCTNYYCKGSEKTIIWNDTDINIEWPIVYKENLIISNKDKQGIKFRDL